MSRAVSSILKSAVFAQRTSQYFLFLMTISHADITTIRVVNNYSDVSSGGNTYTGYPFSIVMPDNKGFGLRVVIDNVDATLVDEIRALTGAATVELSIVLGDTPDVIEWGPYTFDLRNVGYDAHMIKGDLRIFDVMSEPYPGISLTPKVSPGSV